MNEPHLSANNADIIAHCNYQFGAVPKNMLCIVSLKGEQLLGTMFYRLSEEQDIGVEYSMALIEHIVRALGPSEPSGAIVVVFSDRPREDWGLLLGLVHVTFDHMLEWEIANVLRVTSTEWGDYLDEDDHHSLDEVNHSKMAVHMIAQGQVLNDEPDHGLPDEPGEHADQFGHLVETYRLAIPRIDPWDWSHEAMVTARKHWADALDNPVLSDQEAAQIVAYYQRDAFRDRLMADVLVLTDDKAEFVGAMKGEIKGGISLRRIQTVIKLLTNLTSRSPLHQRPDLLAAIAWCHWLIGQNSFADSFLELAHEIDERHQLTNLLHKMIVLQYMAPCSTTPPRK